MSDRTRSILKLGVALLLAIAAVWVVAGRYRQFRRSGENQAEVWFYDQQKKEVYAASRDIIPPDGHRAGGVRAVVVAFRGQASDPAKRRIAFLQTYGQPLKDVLERVKAARASGKPSNEPVPPRDCPLFRTNDLVRRVEETQWHIASSPEGRQIISEWKSWRGPAGEQPILCSP